MHNRYEKLLLPLLIATGSVFLISCGKADKNPNQVVLHMLCGPDVGGGAKEIIKKFEAAYPDITVDMIEGPASTDIRENMYSTSFMAKESTYDTMYMDVVWLPKFASQGWLRPLDDFFAPKMQKEFLPGDIEASRYEGKIYRIPAQSDGGMLYYRKDLLEKNGFKPPKTWQELVSIAQKLQKPPEVWGFVFQGKQYEGLVCNFLEWVWGNGGSVLNAKGEVVLDHPEAIEALKFMTGLIHQYKISPKGILTYQEEEARHAFQQGKAVFMRNWPYCWELLQKDDSPVKGKIGILPMVHAPKRESAATLGGWGYGISAFSKHPEAAWKFIWFAANQESQKIAYLKSGIIPARRALFRDHDILKASPHYKNLLQVLMHAKPRPVHAQYAKISDIIQVHVSAALSGQEDPAGALQAAAREIRALQPKQ